MSLIIVCFNIDRGITKMLQLTYHWCGTNEGIDSPHLDRDTTKEGYFYLYYIQIQ